jgi:hypothetical protein
MKVKLSDLEIAVPALKKLVNMGVMYTKDSYRLSKIVIIVDGIIQNTQSLRATITNKYKKMDEERKVEIIPRESIEDFNREIEELMNLEEEIDINTIDIKLSSLGEKCGITPVEFSRIDKVFVNIEDDMNK